MNYLLDTHTFIWSLISTDKLSLKVKAIIQDKENISWVSAITFWEISLKYAIGKLDLKGVKPDELYEYSANAGFATVDLQAETAATFYKLGKIENKDPFDRMLAWQAIRQDFCLLTKDPYFTGYKNYGLETAW